jgi:hypothetical protein
MKTLFDDTERDGIADFFSTHEDDPSGWEPDEHVRRHVKGTILKCDDDCCYVDDPEDYTTRTIGILYKRVNFPHPIHDTSTVFMLEIEAEFWYNNHKVEVEWSLFAGDPEDDGGIEYADEDTDYSVLLATGNITYPHTVVDDEIQDWPAATKIIEDVKEAVRKSLMECF